MMDSWLGRTFLVGVALLTAGLSGCSCGGGGGDGQPCVTTGDCPAAEVCVDDTCVERGTDAGPDTAPDAVPDSSSCADGRSSCGAGPSATCCAATQLCMTGTCVDDCGGLPVCAGLCCEAGQECLDDACVIECDPANRCGGASELCCTADEACFGAACVGLGEPCTLTEECEVSEICLAELGRCVPRDSVEVCEFRPPVGVFTPTVGCQWVPEAGDSANFDDVVMTPSVANMTDDNGDGATDTLDIPDIVFISFNRQADGCCTSRGRIRIVDGACNADGTMNTHATIVAPFVGNSSGIALGNLHADDVPAERAPEIVATFKNGGTIAFRRTADDGSAWEELWRNTAEPRNAQTDGGAQPALADLDRDGRPEVIVGNSVLDGLTGALIWNGRDTVGASGGVGNNAFLGPASTVADLDLDGFLEVIAGNTVYNGRDGSEVWTYDFVGSGSRCSGAIPCDGFNGVGDFDDDPEGEVVIVRRGEVFVLNHDGTELHRVTIPKVSCADNESGPPTIADFDGDGRPEIGTAGADYYVVVDFDCAGDPLPAECDSENILWKVRNRDCSSRATGSSVFDFEGDGAAEVVYADETNFRIFDGRDGTVLFDDDTHRSNTRMEMPIVVDVDNDGKSEVIIPEPNTGSTSLGGIEVWEDADNNWVRTRRIWNQHTYHVTNITEDGQVPRDEEPNWRNGRLNNFRQNVQPGGLFDAPDLQILAVELDECDPLGVVRIAVTVTNAGAASVPAGILVSASATTDAGDTFDLGVQPTTMLLLPGGSETILFEWDTGGFTFSTFTVNAIADDDGMGTGEYNECLEDNNELMGASFMVCDFG